MSHAEPSYSCTHICCRAIEYEISLPVPFTIIFILDDHLPNVLSAQLTRMFRGC